MSQFDTQCPLAHDIRVSDPDLSHISAEQYERIYEPSEDSFMMMEAFECDLNAMRFIIPHTRPTVLEIGPGSGILSCYLRQLLKSSTPLSAADGDAVEPPTSLLCGKCGHRSPYRPVSLAADLNPDAAALSARTLARHEPVLAACPAAADALVAAAAARGPADAVAGPLFLPESAAEPAAEIVIEPAVRVDIDVRCSDLLSSFPPPPQMPPVDLLVFNPPYVPSSASEAADPDVYVRSYAGGARGRAVLDRLVPLLRPYLAQAPARGSVSAATVAAAAAPAPAAAAAAPAPAAAAALQSVMSAVLYLVVMLPFNDVPSLLPFLHAHTGLCAHSVVARAEGIETLAVFRFADPRWLRGALPRAISAPPPQQQQQTQRPAAAAYPALPQNLGLRFPVLASYVAGTASAAAADAVGSGAAATEAGSRGPVPPLLSECMHHGLACSAYLSVLAPGWSSSTGTGTGTCASAAAPARACFCACPCDACHSPLPASDADASSAADAVAASGAASVLPAGWRLDAVFVRFTADGAAALMRPLSAPTPVPTPALAPASDVPATAAADGPAFIVVMLDGRNTIVASEVAAAARAAAALPGADAGDRTSRPVVAAPAHAAAGAPLSLGATTTGAAEPVGARVMETDAAAAAAAAGVPRRSAGASGYRLRMSGRGEMPRPRPEFCTPPGSLCRCQWFHPQAQTKAAPAPAPAAAEPELAPSEPVSGGAGLDEGDCGTGTGSASDSDDGPNAFSLF